MRIVSLLPSATEIAYALGLGDDLVGVTSACDFPVEARSKEVVSGAVVGDDGGLSAAELDRVVSAIAAEGGSMYTLDSAAMGRLDPEVILTQDLCRVCAVPSGQVDEALRLLGCRAQVVSLDPSSLEDVLDDVVRVGRVAGVERRAEEVVAGLRARVDAVREATRTLRRVPVFPLEWLDPPFTAGHWVPEVVELAGGTCLGAMRGQRSMRTTWAEVVATSPEVVVAMPCGYGLDQAAAEAEALRSIPGLESARLVAVDANAAFSRPGPRLVDGLEALAAALHPDVFPSPSPSLVRLLP